MSLFSPGCWGTTSPYIFLSLSADVIKDHVCVDRAALGNFGLVGELSVG